MARMILVVSMVLAFAPAAGATDGVLEINQACAVNTGCFSGDSPGWPVRITAPGSYLLTSNLVIPDASETALQVNVPSVSIDLGGFEIVTEECLGANSDCTPETGSGKGIYMISGPQVGTAVENGSVTGMGAYGVYVGPRGSVDNVRVRWTRVTAIYSGGGSRVTHNIVTENGVGIASEGGSFLAGNTVSNNTGPGINFNSSEGGYADNVLSGNGTAVTGGTNMGGNVCDGAVCP